MKIKMLFSTVLLIFALQLVSAQKFISKNGHIWFYSNTPLETIEAHNQQVVSILDISNGDIAFNLLVKAFTFKRALMQEHFNENYIESDKYPKSSFKGKITNLDNINFRKDGTYNAEISGELTIHGVTKSIKVTGTFEVKGEKITGKSKFEVLPKDYGILIPSVVQNKFAKQMDVNVDITYTPNK
jgi:hypothetical protein